MDTSETKHESNYWEEEARRYAGNADFWRDKCRELESRNALMLVALQQIHRMGYTDVGDRLMVEAAIAANAAANSPLNSPFS